jgi:hypothetical protein
MKLKKTRLLICIHSQCAYHARLSNHVPHRFQIDDDPHGVESDEFAHVNAAASSFDDLQCRISFATDNNSKQKSLPANRQSTEEPLSFALVVYEPHDESCRI